MIDSPEAREQLKQELHNDASRVQRIFHRLFPSMLEARVTWEMHARAEAERREQLGPFGRTLEDARFAVGACLTRSMWANHQEQRASGQFMPLLDYPDSYPSYSRTVEKYLAEAGIVGENVLTRLNAPRFAFAVALDESGEIIKGEDTNHEVYLAGLGTDSDTVVSAYKLTPEYFDGLPASDQALLEKASADLLATSSHAVFSEFMDKRI